MGWFKKKVKNELEVEKFARQFSVSDFPPTPKHILPVINLARQAEHAHNAREHEVANDLLRAEMNHIKRYMTKQ